MFDAKNFVRQELAKAGDGTGRQHHWWIIQGEGEFMPVGVGDINPVRLRYLAEQLGEGTLVLCTSQSGFPATAEELDYWSVLVRRNEVLAVRDAPCRLAYGAKGVTASSMWAILHQQ